MILTLLLAIASANVTVQIEEIAGADPEAVRAISAELIREIETRSGDRLALEPRSQEMCGKEERCLDELRARTGADQLLILSFFGGLTKIRLIAERVRFEGAKLERRPVEVEGGTDPAGWKTTIVELARQLYPEPRPPPVLTEAPRAKPPVAAVAERPLTPWIFAGAAIVALGTSIVFGASSVAANGSIDDQPRTSDELASLTGRAQDHALLSGIFVSCAAALAITGAVLSIE